MIDPNALADRAHAAMMRPPAARADAERIAALAPAERAAQLALLTPDARAEAIAYALRRSELVGIYGESAAAMQEREDRLAWLRRDEPAVKAVEKIAWVKRYYGRDGDTMATFIDSWGYTVDTRLIAEGRNPVTAFSLFPKQRELVKFVIGCWLDSKPGVVVKSRDVGATWVTMALLCTLCIFRQGFMAGVGSALEVQIDRTGDPDTLFYKIRTFLEHLPAEFNAGFSIDHCSADKRVSFPLTGSSIAGRAGDQSGRGQRSAIFVVDESAHYENPKAMDKNLSATTRCRIDLSSVNGQTNSFYQRAHNPNIRRFDFTWRDDPRKDQKWYEEQCLILDEVTRRQELDCDFTASLEGAIIPSDWARAMVDIDKYLGIDLSAGALRAALDIADRGADMNAFAIVKGRRLHHIEQWSGKGSDTGYSVQRAMGLCTDHGLQSFDYDADGMGGAAVHSDARLINEIRGEQQTKLKSPKPAEYFATGPIATHPYRGSEAVINPEAIVPGTKRRAKDMFANRKAQTWYEGRLAAYNAYQARQGKPYDRERIFCIPGDTPLRELLLGQLSQATAKQTLSGKMQVDKNPDEMASPDLADALLMAICRRKGMSNMAALLKAAGG